MKILVDLLVLILFFGTYFVTKDIYMATGVAVVGGVVQAIYTWVKYKKLDAMQLISLFIILIFGGATLWFHDDNWIKWKPTVLYWTFSLILLGGLVVKRNLLKDLLGKEIEFPNFIWVRLSYAWILFFILLGGLNLVIAYHFSLEQWVTFKVFGATALLIVFMLIQGFFVRKYLPKS